MVDKDNAVGVCIDGCRFLGLGFWLLEIKTQEGMNKARSGMH